MVSTLHDCKRKEKYKIIHEWIGYKFKASPRHSKGDKVPEKLYLQRKQMK